MIVVAPSTKATRRVYRASKIKRHRRTKADILALKVAIVCVLEAEQPATCRQVFYQLVSRGLIPKNEREYNNVVIRLLVQMRMGGHVPFDWISDNTRWVRKPQTFNGLGDFLTDMQGLYRRDVWKNQAAYVEVWCEKDALAGVLSDVTFPWGVPLMVSKGYPSLTYLQSTGLVLEHIGQTTGKVCYLYQFGDHDPSGVDIGANIERRLREFAPSARIRFERIAVTPEQIEEWNLPTRPTKKTDTRSKGFAGESVDVDAIPPNKLRELCKDCITRHIDTDAYQRTIKIEKRERETLQGYMKKLLLPGRRGART